MPCTIKDVSKATGLAQSTISKYINGGNVLPENQVLIKKAIDEMGFRINSFARGLKTNKSNLIGIVIPHITNPYISLLISEVETLLRKNNYATLVCNSNGSHEIERQNIEFLVSKSVDGIINIPLSRSGTHLDIAVQYEIPCIILEVKYDKRTFDSVIINNLDIIKQATEEMIKKGHRYIGYIGGSKDTFIDKERVTGYTQALIENNLPVYKHFIVDGDYTFERAHMVTTELLKNNKEITGLLVTDPQMTSGSLLAIGELNLSVPKDLSFIGFDDQMLTKIYRPKLTVIVQPIDQIARAATGIMLSNLKKQVMTTDQTVRINAHIDFGDTVIRQF